MEDQVDKLWARIASQSRMNPNMPWRVEHLDKEGKPVQVVDWYYDHTASPKWHYETVKPEGTNQQMQ